MPTWGDGLHSPLQLEGVESLAAERPLVVAVAAGLVLVALALSTLLLVRQLRRTPGVRLHSALADVDSVSILMHPNPDPDSMACAIGVRLIAERVGTETKVQYPGEIQHQENRAFEAVLDLELERIRSVDELGEVVVLVDHSEPRGFEGAETVEPYAIIDHHPGRAEGRVFTDCRVDVGSCSSIVTEYLRDLGWRPVATDQVANESQISTAVATGLACGIQTDTKGLTRGCSELDFEASSFLHTGVDSALLDRIANPPVSSETLDIKARAISSRVVRGPFAVSHVGPVSNADAIAQGAEELLRLEGVSAVVVAGEYDGTLHLSGRSRDDRIHMGRTLDAVLSEFPLATAGGHARMGGGQCAMQALNGTSRQEVTDRLFAALAGQR